MSNYSRWLNWKDLEHSSSSPSYSKISENYCPCLYLSIGQVCWLYKLWFKRYIHKCIQSHLLIFIMMSQIWQIVWSFKRQVWISWEQDINFQGNKKIVNMCLRWHILRSYCFVVEVAFKGCIFLHWTGYL